MDTLQRRGAAGFSFVELLVTIIVAGVAFAVMVPLFVQAQQATSADKMRAVAINVAQDRIEKLRHLDFELITEANLLDNSFYFGEFGDSWTEHTESGQKTFNVTYDVVDTPVSETDSRIAYKVVTVSVDWTGPPFPVKDAVLTTMFYRQYSGPEIVDFVIPDADLGLSDPDDASSEKMIVTTGVDLVARVNAGDLDAMAPRTIGAQTLEGRVDFLVTSSTGVAYPTVSVPYSAADGPVFSTVWTAPGGTGGVADGYYTFKALAFSSMSSPGNSWELVYRLETGAPAPVSQLAGTIGLSSASLTWNASPTGDVVLYRVKRDGVTIAELPRAAGSMGYIDDALSGPSGTTYVFSIHAVDWVGNESPAVELALTSFDTSGITPPPRATDLQAEPVNATARLTWSAPTGSGSTGVLGYFVYQMTGAGTQTYTTATATLEVPQGWGTTASYQVKPFVIGSVTSNDYATLLAGQSWVMNTGVRWAEVVIAPESRYTLVIQNTTNRTLSVLKLYYLGPSGADPAVQVPPTGSSIAKNASYQWTDLASGKYRWEWVQSSSGKTGSQTGWCTGASLTIYGGTP
jgi:type II secretory pathway pseudopilin PulG